VGKRILIINGHPDPSSERFCAALALAYATGARAAGHEVRSLTLGTMDVPFLSSKAEFESGLPSGLIRAAQEDIRWCEHLVIVFPLWLGAAPARLKAFLEQVLRQGFAFEVFEFDSPSPFPVQQPGELPVDAALGALRKDHPDTRALLIKSRAEV